jgi:small conductance mechanosensitive channel
MRVRIPSAAVLATLLFVELAAVGAARSQDESATAEAAEGATAAELPALVVEAQDLLARIGEEDVQIEDLRASRKAAPTDEERRAVNRRLLTKELENLDLVNALSDNVLEQEAQELDAKTFRAEVEPRLRGLGPRARRAIEAAEKELAAESARRETLPDEERDELDGTLTAQARLIDDFYRVVLENGERLEAMGLDATKELVWLKRKLPNRAGTLAGRLELAADERRRARTRAEAKPEDVALQDELARLEKQVNWIAESLTSTVQTMQALELDTADYQQLLIERTGRIGGGLLDLEVAGRLFRRAMERLKEWVAENAASVLARALLFVFIVFVFRILARITGRLVERSIASSKLQLSQLLQKMFISLASKGVMVIGVLVALSQLGIQIGPMLAGLGIAGFIVGFALQDTLSNFAAGMMILVYRPFDVDDVIEAGAVMGKVSAMSLVSTTILTFDNQTLVVPNNKIWGDVIRNVTAQRVRRVDLVFGIGYESDIPHAEQVLHAIVKEHPMVLEDPEPVIKLHNLGDSSVDFIVRPWARTEDYWDVYWDITREVKLRLDREGISIPFPQRDVHLIAANGSGEDTGPA